MAGGPEQCHRGRDEQEGHVQQHGGGGLPGQEGGGDCGRLGSAVDTGPAGDDVPDLQCRVHVHGPTTSLPRLREGRLFPVLGKQGSAEVPGVGVVQGLRCLLRRGGEKLVL